ncbi:MAG: hypothetical protein IJ151_01020 [Bacteroidales bacterium]|nr:hypothetical protein [Bacteroidales bacterium]
MKEEEKYGPDVTLYPDGKYRWIYEMNLYTNPTILITVAKVMLGTVLGLWIFFTLIFLIGGNFDAIVGMAKAMGIVMGLMSVLTILGYYVYCLIVGGKYIVLFEMDETQIKHIQLPQQFKRAQAISLLAALAGIASGRPSVAGAGLLAATKQASTSVYASVKNIKVRRRRHLIKVNQLFNKNQVYVPDAWFDFVLDYIRSRCPQVKV